MAAALPSHLVMLFVGGVLCVAFVGVFVAIYSFEQKTSGGYASVPGALLGTVIAFGLFYAVGWMAYRFL